MKPRFNRSVNKTIILLLLANILIASLFAMQFSSQYLRSYDKLHESQAISELNHHKSLFDQNILKIEAAEDVVNATVVNLYDFIVQNNQSMDLAEERLKSFFTSFLIESENVTDSVYVYFDPEKYDDVHDVWLTNEANSITRHEEIPLDRYVNRDNMEWFYSVKESRENNWIKPYRNRYNQYISSYVQPLIYEDEFIGILGMYLDLTQLQYQLNDIDASNYYFWICNEDGDMIYHPYINEGDKSPLDLTVLSQETYFESQTTDDSYHNYITTTTNGWYYVYSVSNSYYNIERRKIVSSIIVSNFLLFSILLTLLWFTSQRLKSNYKQILNFILRMGKGDYSTRLTINEKENIGELASALTILNENTKSRISYFENVAFYNKNTGLPDLDKLIYDFEHHSNPYNVVLYVLDVDNFKAINQFIGREQSDVLIKDLGEQLNHITNDKLKLYNTAGNEFIFIEYADNYNDISNQAEMILQVFSQYTTTSTIDFAITCSIGISKYPDDALSLDLLISNAKNAMTEAKNSGKNTYKIFSRFNNIETISDLEEEDIELAIENNEFIVEYQPQHNIHGEVTNVEALVRWKHPSRGTMYPSIFLPYCIENGYIARIGEFVLRQMIHDYNQLLRAYPKLLTMTINYSIRELLSPQFVSMVLGQLREHSFDPKHLEIDISESALRYDREKSIKKINALTAAGITFSIDQFDANTATLNNVTQVPFKKVKFSRSFVQDVIHNEQLQEQLTFMLIATRSLKIEPIAIGVETEDQYNLLKSLGFTTFQGYYFDKKENTTT